MTGCPPDPSASERQRRLGLWGERQAAAEYRRRGFTSLDTRLATRRAEIDLLVRRRHLLVAVEVKTRSRAPTPELAVDERRLERLAAALWVLAPHLYPRPRRLRVDVAAVCGEPLMERCEVRLFVGSEFDAP
jgi:putative endonuclease